VLNVTKIVQLALSHVMDCYFAIRTSPLTNERIQIIKQKLHVMSIHFIALFQCNRKFLEEEDILLPESRKIHAIQCTMPHFLQFMGNIDIADTASWESVHRLMTVSLWDRTSKRLCSMNEEMSKAAMLLNYRSTVDLIDAVNKNGLDKYIKYVGPHIGPEIVVTEPIRNKSNFIIVLNSTNNLQCQNEEYMCLDNLLKGSSLTGTTLTKVIVDKFGINFLLDLTAKLVLLTGGISIEGNVESKIGKVLLYATNEFKKNVLRYDFAMIQISDGLQPAQMLAFLSRESDNIIQYFAIIRYLRPSFEQPSSIYNCPFTQYEWEYMNSASTKPIVDIIEVSTIAGPAFMTPVFQSNKRFPICSKPNRSDKFWYLHRNFFDRAGWEDIHTINEDGRININDLEIILPECNVDGSIELCDIDSDSGSDSSTDNEVFYDSEDN
jgi:hypothetical protein